MIKWKNVLLRDRDVINRYYEGYSSDASDYCFEQLYLWKDLYKIKYAVIEGYLVVKLTCPYSRESYIHMPVGEGNVNIVINKLEADFKNKGDILSVRSVTRDEFNEMKSLIQEKRLTFKLDRDEFEYLYKSRDLYKLDTKAMSRKRNLYERFIKKHDVKYINVSQMDRSLICSYLDKWYKSVTDTVVLHEKNGVERLLNEWDYMDLEGCVLEVDQMAVGMTIGTRLNDDVFLVLVEKADKRLKESYTTLIRGFAEIYTSDFKYVNRQEDLGIDNLRKAKMLMRPCGFVEKGTIFF